MAEPYARKDSIPWLLRLAITGCLLYFFNAIFDPLFLPSTFELKEGQQMTPPMPPVFILYVCACTAFSLLAILSRARQIVLFLLADRWVLLLFAYLFLSCLWAIEPVLSLYLVCKFLWGFLFGLFLALRFTPRQLLSLFAGLFTVIIISSLFFCLFVPQVGLQPEGSWRGALSNRNLLAMEMNFAIATLVAAAMHLPRFKLAHAALGVLAAVLIFPSYSATGILTFFALVPLMLFLPLLRFHLRLCLVVALAGITTLGAAWGIVGMLPQIDPLLAPLQKNSDLDGRTDIWKAALQATDGHLIAGYGAQHIAITRAGQVVTETAFSQQKWDYLSYDSHNTYITLLLKYGLIGVALFAVQGVRIFRHATKELLYGTSPTRYWYVWLMAILLIFMMTLSADHMLFFWMFFALFSASPRYSPSYAGQP